MKQTTVRMYIASILCILLISLFAFITLHISHNTIVGFDRPIINTVQGWEAPRLTPIMIAFSFIGSTNVVLLLIIVVTALLYLGFRARLSAYFFFFVLIGTGVLNQTLKFIFKRTRPELHRLAEASGYSFPSGHTMMGFSLYAMAVILLWRHIRSAAGKAALLAFAIFMFGMIAISRIYLGVHYPSDIVGGIVASGFWIIISVAVFDYVQERKKRSLIDH